ncbi:hypothetical protein V8E55_002995 [Tylopilus felleus]
MPPGPTVVQLPLFDTLMAILREHWLAQLATADQQRELMRYMGGLNDWLARDRLEREEEEREADPGHRGTLRRQPTGRSASHPDIDEHDAAPTVPPFSPVPPTIRIPGPRAHSPDYPHERIPPRDRYPATPSERETHRRRPSFEMEDAPDHPHRHPSTPVPVPPPPPDIETESILGSMRDAAAPHSSEILDTIRLEREDIAREREALVAEREHERAVLDEARRLLDEELEVRIGALEEELARTRGELDNERQLRMTEANEVQMAAAERDEALRNQLADLTNMVQQNQALCEEKRALMDEHWAEKQRWKEERDGQRQANEGKPGIEQVMEELQRQNAEQRDLLNALSEGWRVDSNRQHQETINAVRATANEQVPYNVQGYLYEVGKLREERRNIQHELGCLMMMKSKYGPGGEFDPDWTPPIGPAGPPPPPEDIPSPHPAWRTVLQRTSSLSRKRSEPPPPEPVPEPRQGSWVSWRREFGCV